MVKNFSAVMVSLQFDAMWQCLQNGLVMEAYNFEGCTGGALDVSSERGATYIMCAAYLTKFIRGVFQLKRDCSIPEPPELSTGVWLLEIVSSLSYTPHPVKIWAQFQSTQSGQRSEVAHPLRPLWVLPNF